jgi:O-antigen biosynthesis protein
MQTLHKINKIWRERGTLGFLKFAFRSIKKRIAIKHNYQSWIIANQFTTQVKELAKQEIETWDYHPLFSILLPVYNIDDRFLRLAIESVRDQVYSNWELCIVDDFSMKSHIRETLNYYRQTDPRIKVIFNTKNSQISASSNSALGIASGDYIVLLDHDDELSPDALFENAKLIQAYPEADFIYSDEDQIDTLGKRFSPFFKPDWSPDYFHACMYTCHLSVYRTQLIREIGGFRSEFDGSQDYDLVLRVAEKTDRIHHIPKILYHWRVLPSSVTSGEAAKPWAYEAAQRALEDMLKRSSYPGHVEKGISAGFWRVRRDITEYPLISIIIPSAGTKKQTSKGNICLLENCIRSILQLTTYPNVEIIVVDGYDIPLETLNFLKEHSVKLIRSSDTFNFSQRINLGVQSCSGKVLVLLNDDTEVITPDWLVVMLEFAQQPQIGAVGAKLLYPDNRIQHAGVLILNGNPTHAFHGVSSDHPGYFYSNFVNRNYLAVTAACLMIRKDLFNQVGGFDQSFPLNYNDVNFCLKLHELGYRQVFTPYAELIHYESASRSVGLQPGEWECLHQKWNHYLSDLCYDPYYNINLCIDHPNFDLSVR